MTFFLAILEKVRNVRYKLKIEKKVIILCLYLTVLTISIIVCNSQKSDIKSKIYFLHLLYLTAEMVNVTAPLVFVVFSDQIKLIPDFAHMSNENDKQTSQR